MELTDNMSEIMNLYNFFDSVIVTDDRGIIKYYTNMRADVYWPDAKNITGMHILKLHPELTEETSSIMRVLKTGEPVFNQLESFYSSSGQSVTNIYCTLPLLSDGKMVGAIDFARVIGENERKNIVLPGGDKERYYTVNDIISNSPEMIKIKDSISQVAQTDSSVLIYGETGTGKEMIAQAIHSASKRTKKKFVVQNCAAIPATLLEGILFGTVRGAFTGAENRKGLFQEADGGTLYLDEINSMPLNLQAKLLRVLQEKQVMPLGSTQPIAVDVRIVSSSNCPPDELVRNGELRPDLLYRLNTVTLAIPPLNQRPDDIPLLSEYFLYKYSRVLGRPVPQMAQETILFLSNCRWHGNVRELEHAIEAALNVLGEGSVLSLEHLPAYLTMREPPEIHQKNTEPTLSLPETMGLYEKKLILQALMSCGGKIVEAAALLQIPRTTLQYKIRKYGLMIE